MEAKFKAGELAITYTQEGFKLVSVMLVITDSKPSALRQDSVLNPFPVLNKIQYIYGVTDGTMGAVEYIKEYDLYPIINIENFKIKKVGV